MYKIKQRIEDFIVEEVPLVKPRESGRYILYLLEKRNTTTQSALNIIRKKFNLKQSEIGYSGLKDKHAITKQFITIKKKSFLKRNFSFDNFSLKFLGFINERLLLGNLKANKFVITVRNLNDGEVKSLKSFKQDYVFFPNYFGNQRFSENNPEIGLALLRQDFNKVLNSALNSSKNQSLKTKLLKHLELYKNDSLGALRLLSRNILLLYIHSFQSLIFNQVLSNFINNHCSKSRKFKIANKDLAICDQDSLIYLYKRKFPIVGFGSEGDKDSLWNEALSESLNLLGSFGIKRQSFITKRVPELSLEGSSRDAVVKAENFTCTLSNDELNPNFEKAVITFTLPKGSYATVLLNYLLSLKG